MTCVKTWDIYLLEATGTNASTVVSYTEQTPGAAAECNFMLAAHFEEHFDSLAQWEENSLISEL